MSCDWPTVRLGELADITSSKRIKRADYVSSGVPFFRSKEVIERSKGNNISTELFISEEHFSVIRDKFGAPEAGDILLTSVGTLGVPYQVRSTDRFYFKDGNLTWLRRFQESVLPEYVLYWLRSPVAQRKLDEVSIGSTQRALTIVALKSVEIPLPPKAVQARIVDMAMSLDQKLETNRAINQTLEQIAQAIFKSWFVDFEPVKAKIAALEAGGSEEDALLAAMQAISGKSEAELTRLQAERPEQYAELRATAELFPSAMQDSELGEIPEGWGCTTLANLCTTITKGTTPKKSELAAATDDAVVHFIKVKDITGTGEIIREGLEEIPDSISRKSLKRSILKNGDLLFSIAGTIGRVAIVDATLEDSNTNQAVGIIRLSEQEKHLALVWQTLLSDRVQNEIRSKVVQGVQANASLKNLRDIQVVRPCDKLLYTASSHLSALLKEISSNHAQSRNLTELRDTLLPKLLSGELSVTDPDGQQLTAVEPANV